MQSRKKYITFISNKDSTNKKYCNAASSHFALHRKRMTNFISDSKERQGALHPAKSFIVQAPAGSGKTELLILRFLTLLSIVTQPEQILAITFTRKAAGEMHSRIMSALEKACQGIAPEKSHERETYNLSRVVLERNNELEWNLIENPARLKVQTIDALCSSLTRQMPILSHLGKQPAISENQEELYREAVRRTIARVEEGGRKGEAVRQALKHLDNSMSNLEKRLIGMMKRRDQWLRHVNLKKPVSHIDLRHYLESSIQRVIENNLTLVRDAFPPGLLEEVASYGRYAATNLLEAGTDNHKITALHNLTSLIDTTHKSLPLWRAIRSLLLTNDNGWRKSGGINVKIGFPSLKTDEAVNKKKGFKELLEIISGEGKLRQLLEEVATLPDGRYDEREWAILQDLLHLLPLAGEELEKVFAEKSTVDFQAISMAAINALGSEEEPTDLMLSLDVKIQHILVDEYQDTSRIQLSLLKSLTCGWEEGDGRTLFIVGDPMQSIYLFREAEVGLFLAAREDGVGNIKLTSLTLRSNFRSQEGIITWANNVFDTAFPESEDRFLGSICYERFSPVCPTIEGDAVNITIYNRSSKLVEADDIIQTVQFIAKNCHDETVAILARSRSHLSEIVKALKEAAIDFKTTDLDPLMGRPVIQDLFAILRVLLHPCDKAAWLAMLRAPWCGLTLEDLHKLSLNSQDSTVWELMWDENKIKTLSDEGQTRLISLREKIETTKPLSGRVQLRPLLEGLWIELGGPACADDDSISDAEAFFNLVDTTDVGGEIEPLQLLEEKVKNLYALHSGKGVNPVEVLTIHKSKGLEYDHVIIPGLGRPPRHRDKELLCAMERDRDLLLAPIEGMGNEGESSIYKYLNRLQVKKELFEQTRLFYVAVTRAKKKLYLFGHVREGKGDDFKIEASSFLSNMKNFIKKEDILWLDDDDKKEEGNSRPLQFKRLPAKWQIPEAIPDLNISAKSKELTVSDDIPEFLWAGEEAKQLGTVAHKYLCKMAKDGLNIWTKKKIAREKEIMESIFRQLGMNKTQASLLTKRGLKMLEGIISDNKGKWILAKHLEAESEKAFTSVLNGKIVHTVIDRTFVESNTRWVIDYKTGSHKGGDLISFLQNEKKRYEKQLDIYVATLVAGGEKRKIRKGLYYPAILEWIEC